MLADASCPNADPDNASRRTYMPVYRPLPAQTQGFLSAALLFQRSRQVSAGSALGSPYTGEVLIQSQYKQAVEILGGLVQTLHSLGTHSVC